MYVGSLGVWFGILCTFDIEQGGGEGAMMNFKTVCKDKPEKISISSPFREFKFVFLLAWTLLFIFTTWTLLGRGYFCSFVFNSMA